MDVKVRGYIYQYKFLWLGWFVVHKENPTPLYYDNTPTVTLYSETDLEGLVFGFTRSSVTRKMKRYALKHFAK